MPAKIFNEAATLSFITEKSERDRAFAIAQEKRLNLSAVYRLAFKETLDRLESHTTPKSNAS